ncbi:hypothetical protein MATL_G00126330 [Megalops atlanticus]|uniref:Uncharacterized protein n=1 Tax=Megalops atlanticus TaxID=7932 RepID=A0A9D3PVH5_MEGAT|nr:hypothetical protein MATL_G00126330 [Megalops atlanticus]
MQLLQLWCSIIGPVLWMAGALAEKRIQTFSCEPTECFEVMGSEDPACTPSNPTAICNISGPFVKWNSNKPSNCLCDQPDPSIIADKRAKDQNSMSFENESTSMKNPDEQAATEVPEKTSTNTAMEQAWKEQTATEVPGETNTNTTMGQPLSPEQICAIAIPVVFVGIIIAVVILYKTCR